MTSPWEQVRRSKRPVSPKPPAFTALAERLGIDLDAPPNPGVLDGPVAGSCDAIPDGMACAGWLRFTDQSGEIWEAVCDTCGFETTVSARKIDPAVRRAARVDRAEIPDKFRGVRFVEDEENRHALSMVRSWIDGADPDPDRRVASLLPAPALWSNNGVGKSHLLSALCVRLAADLELSVLYRSARHLLRELQRFEDPAGRERAWSSATSVDVLALDDLGAQQATEWKLDVLADVVDERYAAERPVLVATNFPPEGWVDVLDARTLSRLRGMTFPVELRGRDRRVSIDRKEHA